MFHNVSRFDVSKTVKSYDDCKLYVGGRLILSGVGTIIGVSDSEIKLQIVGGKSRVKYNERFNKEYIDEMDLGKAKHGTDFDADQFQELEPLEIAMLLHACSITDMYGFFGFPFATVMGKYVYTPVYDETNDIIANFMFGKNNYNYIYNTAVHPNLNYILAMVINKMGYVVERNDFAVEPWNRLYIASAYKSDEFRHALPHWTAYTFLEEYRKLFNAKIYFNEQKKTVNIIGTSELLGADTVEIEPLDEFSVDYDEDGSLNTIDTSNVEYNLGDSENRTEYETIPQKVLTGFDVYELNGMAPNLDTEISQWDMKKKRTAIIKRLYADGTLQAYYVWKADEEDDSKGSWFECGEFSPLIRNKDSDDSIELKIAPAACLLLK